MPQIDEVVTSMLDAVLAAFRRDAGPDALGVGVLVWGTDGRLDAGLSALSDDGPRLVEALADVPEAAHLAARRERRVVSGAPDGAVVDALRGAGLGEVGGMAALPTEWGRDGDCVLLVWTTGEPGGDHVDLLARWEPMVVAGAVAAVTCRDEGEKVDEMVRVLQARIVIEQAKGMVMARHRLPAEDAFELLRGASQRSNTPVRRLAQAVVATATATGDGDDPGVAGDLAGRLLA